MILRFLRLTYVGCNCLIVGIITSFVSLSYLIAEFVVLLISSETKNQDLNTSSFFSVDAPRKGN